MQCGSRSTWTLQENKLFENALAVVEIGEGTTPEAWVRVAAMVPGKTPDEVRRHYQRLVEDVTSIDAGYIQLPNYNSPPTPDELQRSSNLFATNNAGYQPNAERGLFLKPSSHQERRKGIPWTEEEHRLFLMGLHKYGKGDWRSISRNFVVSRTPTQVASHAQKYFIRHNYGNKDKRRSSIHDITTINSIDIRQSLARQCLTIPSQNNTSLVTKINTQPSIIMSQSCPIGREPLVDSIEFSTRNENLVLPSYGLGLYNHSGIQVHSSRPFIYGSSLGASQIRFPM